jgi:phosphoribosyl 1,2-cyclic phosphodiesterase
MTFERINPGASFAVGGYRISAIQLNHPGITLGYRVEHGDAAVVVITDTARIRAVQQGHGMAALAAEDPAAFQEHYSQALVDFCADARLLVHDSHFLEDEIAGKEHWGHSTAADALELARRAGARHLMLFHHAPEHSDEIVDQKLAGCRETAAEVPLQVSAAREGMAVHIPEGETC